MLSQLSETLRYVSEDVVWGLPLVVLLIGGGLVLVVMSRFVPLRGLPMAMRLLSGRFRHEGDLTAEGQISHFKALMNALAATIGLGNIAGVAVALSRGGPGAIFWMWVAAVIGMNTKLFECTLAVMYRGKDYRGQTQGGPMYVIESRLGKHFKPLAIFFAVCGLFGTTALFQVNQLAGYVDSYYHVPPVVVGLVSAALVAYVLLGGVTRIAQWTSTLVPVMCVLYVIYGIVILLMSADRVPAAFASIFQHAFSGRAAIGAAEGIGVIAVLRIGVARAAFSNEAGVGTAPMAHSNAKTSEPVSEGLVAMLGPMFDTLIICTITALIILVTLEPAQYTAAEGDTTAIEVTTQAFEQALGTFGRHFLGLAVLLFSFSTMIGMANYNEKCWNYLFKGRWLLTEYVFITWFAATLVLGAISAQDDVVAILDIGYGLMAIPTMISTLILAPTVVKAIREYLGKYSKSR